MAQFNCRVMLSDGRIIEEQFQAESKAELLSSFESRGYRAIQVTEQVQTLANKPITLGAPKTLKKKSLILFCRQMATLLRADIPLVKCFELIAAQTEDSLLKQAMDELSGDIQSGAVLSASMAKQGIRFPEMLIKMVEVGEVTGDMTHILERMATQYESESRISQKVRGAMTYPIVLLGVALVACTFMLIFIVPQFVDVFASMDAELPLLTRILMGISNFLIHFWWLFLLIIPAAVYGLLQLLADPGVKRRIDIQKLTFRPVRASMQKIMCAQFARTLHTLLASGVPIVQAMVYTNNNITNTYARECLDEVIVGLQQGKGISTQLSEYPIFHKLLVSMIAIGEASGNLEDMLSKTADYFDEETEAAIAQLTSLLEPLAIIVVGGLIGLVVVALYLPMFSMTSNVSGGL